MPPNDGMHPTVLHTAVDAEAARPRQRRPALSWTGAPDAPGAIVSG